MKASRFAPEVPNSVAAAAAFESLRTYALLESLRAYEAPYGAIVDAFDEGDYFAFDAEWAASSAALRAACASSKTVARIENARAAVYVAHTILARIDDAAYAAYMGDVRIPENLRRAVLRAKRRLLRFVRSAHNARPGRISALGAVTRF